MSPEAYLEDLLKLDNGGHRRMIKGYRTAFDTVAVPRAQASKYKYNPAAAGAGNMTADEIRMRVKRSKSRREREK